MPSFLASSVSCSGDDHERTSACGYQVAWAINPHMLIGSANLRRATGQHAALLRTVRALGATVTVLPFVHGAFDSVFAKDNALCMRRGDRTAAILSAPRHAVRRAEQCERARALDSRGIAVQATAAFEGGDICVLPGAALLGIGPRSGRDAICPLQDFLDMPVIPLELVDPALYHLDTALTVLADGTALVCEEAFSLASIRTLRSLPLRLVSVSRAAAMQLALNVVEIADAVVTGTRAPEVSDALRLLGRRVVYTPLDEFHRAGGSASCLLAPIHGTAAIAATAAIRSTAA